MPTKCKTENSKEKANQNEVEIKPPNFYIYGYEPFQKLAYIRGEIEMPNQLPTTKSSSHHCKLTQRCNRSNENFHLKLLAKIAKVLTIN